MKKRKYSLEVKIALSILSVIGVVILAAGLYGYKVVQDVKKTSNKIYKEVKTENLRGMPTVLEESDPVSVLLLGVDTGDKGRNEQGRSDSMIVLTINPQKKTTKMVSIPRDTYTDIPGYGEDKINHTYAFGGVALSINTIQRMLNVPIDYYVEVNMKGIKELVDTLDGIEVNNTLDFTYEGTHFPLGDQHFTGELALKYSRIVMMILLGTMADKNGKEKS